MQPGLPHAHDALQGQGSGACARMRTCSRLSSRFISSIHLSLSLMSCGMGACLSLQRVLVSTR
jgi:hypothetical protein